MKGGKKRGMEGRREGGRERVLCIGKASCTKIIRQYYWSP
jgi:hypothetical protein